MLGDPLLHAALSQRVNCLAVSSGPWPWARCYFMSPWMRATPGAGLRDHAVTGSTARGSLQGKCRAGCFNIPLFQAHQAFWMEALGKILLSACTPKVAQLSLPCPRPPPFQSDGPYCAHSTGRGSQALPSSHPQTLAQECHVASELTLPPGLGLPSGGTSRGCTGLSSLPSPLLLGGDALGEAPGPPQSCCWPRLGQCQSAGSRNLETTRLVCKLLSAKPQKWFWEGFQIPRALTQAAVAPESLPSQPQEPPSLTGWGCRAALIPGHCHIAALPETKTPEVPAASAWG